MIFRQHGGHWGGGKFYLVGKGEVFPDSSDSEITRGSVWIISLSSLAGGQSCTAFLSCSPSLSYTHTQASTCQFLCDYHLIKASPCSFSSRERTDLPLHTSPLRPSNVLVVFSSHAVSSAAMFLSANTCMFDILYPLIALLWRGLRKALVSKNGTGFRCRMPLIRTFQPTLASS